MFWITRPKWHSFGISLVIKFELQSGHLWGTFKKVQPRQFDMNRAITDDGFLAHLKRFKDLPAHCGVAFLLSAREFAGRGRRTFQSTWRRLLSAPATKINKDSSVSNWQIMIQKKVYFISSLMIRLSVKFLRLNLDLCRIYDFLMYPLSLCFIGWKSERSSF